MARRLASFTLLAPVALAALLTGCAEQPVVERLPSANFNGPLVVAPPPPPPQLVTPPPTAPKVATVQPPKRTVPALAGVPRDWTPAPGAVNGDGWRWIVIHHSATPAGGAKAFDRMHREKGWDELGYHFVIGNGTDTSDGQIEVGTRWPKQKWGAHAKTPDNQYNRTGIGICLVGNFDNERPTPAQLQSLAKLTAYMMRTYRIPADRVIGHGTTKATDCPGRNVRVDVIRRMATQLAQGDDADPNTAQATTATPAGGELLTNLPPK